MLVEQPGSNPDPDTEYRDYHDILPVDLFNPSSKIPAEYLKVVHGRWLQHHFQLTI